MANLSTEGNDAYAHVSWRKGDAFLSGYQVAQLLLLAGIFLLALLTLVLTIIDNTTKK